MKQMPEAEAKKKKADKTKARVSMTDPDARVMKMGSPVISVGRLSR